MCRNFLKRFRAEVAGSSVGHTLRNIIHYFALAAYPYIRVVVPNFRTAHYVYIITMAFLLPLVRSIKRKHVAGFSYEGPLKSI